MAKAQTAKQAAASVTETAVTDDAPAPDQDQDQDGIPALWIKARSQSIRRCGYRFTAEGMGIALSALTDEEQDILMADPNLIVEEVTGF